MPSNGFPADEYTPHGYLANPYAFARSWKDGSGGNLRSADEAVGFGWLYPWAFGAEAGAQLEIGLAAGEERLLARTDFERVGLVSAHHSALLFEYAWSVAGFRCRARFVLVGRDELGLEVVVGEPAPRPPPRGRGGKPPLPLGRGDRNECVARGEGASPGLMVTFYVAAVAWRRDGPACIARRAEPGSASIGRLDLGEPFGIHELIVKTDAAVRPLGAGATLADLVNGRARRSRAEGQRVAIAAEILLDPSDGGRRVVALLRRHAGVEAASGAGSAGAEMRSGPIPAAPRQDADGSVRAAIEEARAGDERFWRGAARLAGDWPPSWRRGWVYDLETTRMCIFPAGGVFTDVWPAWMIQWPRAVLAEGSLDVLRLAYGDPALAKRATLSLFRDAPAANVPCVFQHGEPNMVAADGSVCGTSPAWCVPFYNLERLYLRTLDTAWLTELYPYLDRYLEWWLAERTDADGWAVYKCTWEAGEDDTPRLDPERRGDNVVSEYVWPVELQATMAQSAAVLGRFAAILGRGAEAARWRSVAEAFAARVTQLWDAESGRFRDWDRRAGRFLEPVGDGEPNYWGTDPCRYSALAFTPLLAGLADAEQSRGLARELEHYAGPPWTMWASWSYVVLEAALAGGERAFASRVAAGIVGRVYDELDRRTLGQPRGPTPGVAREHWPLELDTWRSTEGYGWGATTASYLVRQIFGFLESEVTEGLRFRLAPGLPASLLVPGLRYALVNVPYRGESLDVEYTVLPDALDATTSAPSAPRALSVRIRAGGPHRCRVVAERGSLHYEDERPAIGHTFTVEIGALYEIELHPL